MRTREPPLASVVSVHDVMPETLNKITQILTSLESVPKERITLLVVPGKRWQPQQLTQLRDWQCRGIILAGHGWSHQVTVTRTVYHRLHSLVLSRMAAEHLSMAPEAIIGLMQKCHAWFGENRLQPPALYVPPAWALGLGFRELRAVAGELPFTRIETFSGVYSLVSDQFRRLPLSGFEADNGLRTGVLRVWNRLNEQTARKRQLPLRIGIHPYDLQLGLRDQLTKQIAATDRFLAYEQL